jgi:hypothetical protein
LAADSLDFQAWFGLGECHGRDEIVVPDAASLSGWRFRGSYHTAVRAYVRALELVPSFMFAFRENAYDRLTWLLYTEPNYFRYGHPEGQDMVPMLAMPALAGDTLAFTPYAASLVFASPPVSTSQAAVAGNRSRLLMAVGAWAAAFPDSSRPWTALGRALEVTRQLEGQADDGALDAARRASMVASVFADSLAAATVEVRVLLKLQRFAEAAGVARRIVARTGTADSALSRQLAGLAALTGQVHEAVRYSVLSAPYAASRGRGPNLPPPVNRVREALLAHAAFGVPTDSITILMARLDTLLAVHALNDRNAGFPCQTRWAPRSVAFPLIRETTSDPQCWRIIPILEAQRAVATGEAATVLSVIQRLDSIRASQPPGQVATLDTYLEASALLEIADTTAAVSRLDGLLGAISVLRSDLLPEVQQVTGLIRAMVMRARLAAAAGDAATASRWAQAVVDLWNEAEPVLHPQVDAIRELAR